MDMPLFKIVRRQAEHELEEIPQVEQASNVVYIRGRPYRIIGVYGNTLVVKDLETGEIRTVVRAPIV